MAKETLYRVTGTSADGFPIDFDNLTKSDALFYCKEACLNPNIAITVSEQTDDISLNDISDDVTSEYTN